MLVDAILMVILWTVGVVYALLVLTVMSGAMILCFAIPNSIVVSVLWGWFVVPFFHTPALTLPHAIGLTMLARHLLPIRRMSSSQEKSDQKAVKVEGREAVQLLLKELKDSLSIALSGLGFGWLIHQFM